MADTSVNSVQPSEVSKEMVAYFLTVSILGGGEFEKSWRASSGIPILQGFSKEEILPTYRECLRAVDRRS